jgi:hypothetical protein
MPTSKVIFLCLGCLYTAVLVLMAVALPTVFRWVELLPPERESLRTTFKLGIEYGGMGAFTAIFALTCFLGMRRKQLEPVGRKQEQ